MILDRVDLEELEVRRSLGLINKRFHPTLPLTIWSYTSHCQIEKAWDEYTRLARGLITDKEGKIVSRPFPKFFNLEEMPESSLANLPLSRPLVYEKLDGSLGISYWDGDHLRIATRGSFESEQARWACDWLERHGPSSDQFKRDHTYLFEILYAENRIVVDYDRREDLVLLGVIETATGIEQCPIREGIRLGLSLPWKYDWTVREVIEETQRLGPNAEGFVLHYPGLNLRIKIKGEEYCRLHKLLTTFSSISIWECLSAGESLDPYLDRAPQRFQNWVRNQAASLAQDYDFWINQAQEAFDEVQEFPDRKSQALYLQEHHPGILPFVFGLIDGRDISPGIWKRIRPPFELPCEVEEE